jgi:hypothetical protein
VSFKQLLHQRCRVLRLVQGNANGRPTTMWSASAESVPVRLDLSFIRMGKDMGWTPEAGRAPDRSGVAFFFPDADIRVGDRLEILSGRPYGTYAVEGSVEELLTFSDPHHLEVSVREVAKSVARGAVADDPSIA